MTRNWNFLSFIRDHVLMRVPYVSALSYKASPLVTGCKVCPTDAQCIIFYWITNILFNFKSFKELANDLQTLNFHYIFLPHVVFRGVSVSHGCYHSVIISKIERFMGPSWGPPGSCRPQMGPMLAPKALTITTWPWNLMDDLQKTIGHLFCATSSFVNHFKATGEFKLEL